MADSEQTTTTPEAMRDAVISMAVESWRFGRVFDRLLRSSMPENRTDTKASSGGSSKRSKRLWSRRI